MLPLFFTPILNYVILSGVFAVFEVFVNEIRSFFTCRWLTMQNGSGRLSPQVEVDESWWARPIRRSPVAG